MTGLDVLQALKDGKSLRQIDWQEDEFIWLKNQAIHMSNKLENRLDNCELGIADNIKMIIESLLFFEWEESKIPTL